MSEHFGEGLSSEGLPLRCVVPYEYNYQTWCKERWRDRPLLQVFIQEFKAYSAEYYEEAVRIGAITVNDVMISPDYVIRNGDCILHKTVRHEPPVLRLPLTIVWDLPSLLVINKPCSIPVHSCGAYHKNSLLGILEFEFGLKKLKPVHRLDRVTSGIVVLAKTSKAARSIADLMQQETCLKQYIARVRGRFPHLQITVDAGISCKSQKEGVYCIDSQGKESSTFIEFWKYNAESDTSLVWCRPITGRTHQIRLHLQHLGYPIANDSCYGGEDLQPVTLSDTTYKRIKLEIGGKRIALEESKQMAIWLHAYRYRLTQNLDFTVDLPSWAN
jgi:tRNA pseudouridine synthase 9